MNNYLDFNNTACPGCGQILAARTVVNALAPDVIVVNATGCLEITTTRWPHSSCGVPWIHSLFGNPSSVASGISAVLRHRGDTKTKILVQAGDGSTFDIGFGALSGLWSRREAVIYVCYDNEIYANTGMQSSGSTRLGARTATSPVIGEALGFSGHKKDMLAIALAHNVPYVAQSTSAYLDDLTAKIKKAAATDGPSYIQVLSSCIPGWGVTVKDSVNTARLAAETGLYPLLEFVNGVEVGRHKVPRPFKSVKEYLITQNRFKHLLEKPAGVVVIKDLQKIADDQIRKYKL